MRRGIEGVIIGGLIATARLTAQISHRHLPPLLATSVWVGLVASLHTRIASVASVAAATTTTTIQIKR